MIGELDRLARLQRRSNRPQPLQQRKPINPNASVVTFSSTTAAVSSSRMSVRRPVYGPTDGSSITSSSWRTDMPETLRTRTDKNRTDVRSPWCCRRHHRQNQQQNDAIWLDLRADVRLCTADAGWSSSVARWAHNPEVTGSNPVPATTKALVRVPFDVMTKGTWSFLAAIWQQTSEATDPASTRYAGASHVISCSLGWQPSELDAAPTAWARPSTGREQYRCRDYAIR